MEIFSSINGTIVVENRLCVTEDASFNQVRDYLQEMETLDPAYTDVFELSVFVKFNKMADTFEHHLQNMPVGCQFKYNDMTVIKISKNLCIGVREHVMYKYNDLTVAINKRRVEVPVIKFGLEFEGETADESSEALRVCG